MPNPTFAAADAASRADGFQRVADALQRLGHGHAPCWLEVRYSTVMATMPRWAKWRQ